VSSKEHNFRYGTLDFNGTRLEIVRLRCRGMGVKAIAQAIGMRKEHVERVLRSEFEERLGNRQRLIEDTALQLNTIQAQLYAKWEERGDRKDAELCLKAIEQKRKLFGLDAPVKVDVRQVEEMSEEEILKELEAERRRPQPQLPAPGDVIDAEYTVSERVELEG
jgi:hypothetical protein